MKVLVINGSPKGENSNTFKLTSALLKGLQENPDIEIETLVVKEMDIKPCLGCLSCWYQTPGKCVIDAVMQDVYKKVMAADLVIESFPLFFFGMPGPMKTFTDRMCPLMESYNGFSKTIGNSAFHEPRFDMSGKRLVIVSTCGYAKTEEIYDSLIKELNFIAGKGNYLPLFCPQGEMYRIPLMQQYIDVFVETYKEIGRLLGRNEEIPQELLEKASKPIVPQRAFENLISNYANFFQHEENKQ